MSQRIRDAGDRALRQALRRLATRHHAEAWLGLVVKAFDAGTRDAPDGLRVHTPDHFLVALWAPAAGPPSRWPEMVALASPDPDRALLELVRHLPAGMQVHLIDGAEADLGLLARIVLAGDRNLEPYQRAGLRAFVARERRVEARQIAARYTDRDGAFVAMLERLGAPAPDGEST